MKKNDPTKIVTGKHTVMSYLTVNEPQVPLGGGTPKYSVSLVISKDDTETYNKVKAAINAAYEKGQKKLQGAGGDVPPLEALKTPLRDGDKEKKNDPVYKNCWFINAKSTSKPGVVDAYKQPILDASELYSGIIGRASVSFYAYNVNGSRGIAAGLNHIQKLHDGTPLGGHGRPEDDFDDLDGEEEDFLS